MIKNKVLLKNFSSLSILQVSNYLFPLITFPYLLRVLGPEKYGLMNFAAAFAAYFSILTDYGFNLSIPREISVNDTIKNKIDEIFSSVIIIKIVFFLICLLVFTALVFFIPKFYLEKEIYLLSFIAVLGQAIFPTWFFQGIQKMHFISIITISIRALAVVSIFIFITSPGHLVYLILINGISSVLIGGLSLVIIVKNFSVKFSFQNINILRHYLADGFHLFISSISINLYTTSTVFILGLLAGERFVGYYSAADKIRIAVQNLFSSVTQTIYPHLAGVFKDSVKEGFVFIKKVIQSAGTANLLICLLIFLFSGKIISIVAGPDYSSSVAILRILSFLPFIIFLSNITGVQIMLNLGHKTYFTKIIVTGAFISLTLSFILVPLYKEIGTAVTVLVTELFITFSMIIFINRITAKVEEKI